MQELIFVAINPDGVRREWALQNRSYEVGRADGTPRDGLTVEGDPRLSRHHFQVQPEGEKLRITRAESARNPLFYHGEERDSFELAPGEFFSAGKSQFGAILRHAASEYTLFQQAKQNARLRRLEDVFGAVLDLLGRLRSEAGSGAPWRPAFAVLKGFLPEIERLLFVEVYQHSQPRILEDQSWGHNASPLAENLLERAFAQNSTVTFVWESPEQPSGGEPLSSKKLEGTLLAQSRWAIASPIRGVEGKSYALCAFGSQLEEREEVAAIIDIVTELVGHHMIVEQAAEFSNLLGVFGHHVGTLFKTSGALKLWSSGSDPEVRRVLGHLMPIWGVSQAISLHKKQGEREWTELLTGWVTHGWQDRADLHDSILAALEKIVRYVHASGDGQPPFLPWAISSSEDAPFATLPPLDDNPALFDKTMALTIGLIELLNNLRKYPEARGAGREDRRELSELPEEERRVQVRCYNQGNEAVVEILQPVVTLGDGGIPQSRSLERIRSLEAQLLRGLVHTGWAEIAGPTSLSHIVKIRQRWTYRWGELPPRG